MGNETEIRKQAATVNAVVGLLKSPKVWPFVLAAVAAGGGTGISEALANLNLASIPWYWLAAAAVGMWLINRMGEKEKRDLRTSEDIAEIKAALLVGNEKFMRIEEDVKSLRDCRHGVNNAAMLEAKYAAKTRSEGKLKPRAAGA